MFETEMGGEGAVFSAVARVVFSCLGGDCLMKREDWEGNRQTYFYLGVGNLQWTLWLMNWKFFFQLWDPLRFLTVQPAVGTHRSSLIFDSSGDRK